MSDDPLDDHILLARMHTLLAASVEGLAPTDLAERIAWCEEHNQPGVRAELDGDLIVFTWGGRPLATLHRDTLLDDGPIRGEFIADTPDTVPTDWSDQ